MKPFVKVCGLTRHEDVELAIGLGVSGCGFIFHEKSPRVVEPSFAARYASRSVERFGVFVRQDADEVLRIMDEARLTLAQLHGDQDEAFCLRVGPERVVKVLWPGRYGSRRELDADLARFAPLCRFFLFDAGTSGGGHGKSLDFAMLKGLAAPKPWLLAGGLGPDNLAEAMACQPFGVDLNSGVEVEPGLKDPEKLVRALSILNNDVLQS